MFALWQKQLQKYRMIAKNILEQSRKRDRRDEKRKIIKTQTLFKERDRILLHNDHKSLPRRRRTEDTCSVVEIKI